MQGPTSAIRQELVRRLERIENRDADGNRFVDDSIENALDEILAWLGAQLAEDLSVSAEEEYEREAEETYGGLAVAVRPEALADRTLAVVDSWASVLSYATTWVYAPLSPPPGGEAGAATKILERIRRYTSMMTAPATQAASILGADGWSVSVGFPFGVSVGLSWNV